MGTTIKMNADFSRHVEQLDAVIKEFSQILDEHRADYNRFRAKLMERKTKTPTLAISEEVLAEALKSADITNLKGFARAFSRLNARIEAITILETLCLPKGGEIALKEGATEQDSNGRRFLFSKIAREQEIRLLIPLLKAKEHLLLCRPWVSIQTTQIAQEDEEEDEYLRPEGFNCAKSLIPYWDNLKNYGIVGKGQTDAFLSVESRQYLSKQLNAMADYINANSTTPSKIKNHIREEIKRLDDYSVLGVVFQILLTDGLCYWLEPTDSSNDEQRVFWVWMYERLQEALERFYSLPFGYGDIEAFRPFCDALNYFHAGTTAQQEAQFTIFGDPEPLVPQRSSASPAEQILGAAYTDEVRESFEKAQAEGLMVQTPTGYEWKQSKAMLAYFVERVFCPKNVGKIPEKGLESLFGVSRLSSSISQLNNAKSEQPWRVTINKLLEN